MAETRTGRGDFDAFYARSLDPVFRATLLTVRHRERAEDAVNEAFARAFARWDELRDHPNQVGWVVRVALNVHRSSLRTWGREQPEPPDIPVEDERPIDPWLLRAVWRLPKRQREVVALRILLDMSELRTAEALGINQATVGVHLHRALETLRISLASAGYGSGEPASEAEATS